MAASTGKPALQGAVTDRRSTTRARRLTTTSSQAPASPSGKTSCPSCRIGGNSSICHGGDYDRAQADLWLGPDEETDPTEDDLWFVYRTLIDIQSTVAPELALVRRGDAALSFFMRKLDDCYELPGLECSLDPDVYGAPCGESMPVLAEQLPVAERDLIRSWIESGAPEN